MEDHSKIETDTKYQILKTVFGFHSFRPGQEEVVDTILRRENVLAVMPTGSGKSLCFQVAALGLGGLTIVVSPLVALMQDQVAALKLAGVAAETINSSLDRPTNVETWRRVARGEVRLLYLSPERLMTPRMIEALKSLSVSQFVIDEAHCISQWGPAFRPDYADLAALKTDFPNVPLSAFTATADELTRKDIIERLFRGQARSLVLVFDRPNIKLSVSQKQDARSQMLAFLEEQGSESGIVYCLSRKKTEETAEFLSKMGYKALPYHAGMDPTERTANQSTFMTEEAVVMVATIAFGMGIDKSNVRFVLHLDLPATMEAYYQEFGRAGRDGQPAAALMLYGLSDLHMRRRFIDDEEVENNHKSQQHKRLDALMAYCETTVCRRIPLLLYFGEKAQPCGNCDTCLHPVETVDGSDVGKLAVEVVEKTGQRFGPSHLIDVLRGSNTGKIKQQKHDTLSIFGIGKKQRKEEWRSIFRQLVSSGFLNLEMEPFGGLSLTEMGKRLLTGDEVFLYHPESYQPKKLRKKATSQVPAGLLSETDRTLQAALKALRLDLARERKVPAYVIFLDRSLEEMVLAKPTSMEAFLEINGVGQKRLEEFGDLFIEVVREHIRQN